MWTIEFSCVVITCSSCFEKWPRCSAHQTVHTLEISVQLWGRTLCKLHGFIGDSLHRHEAPTFPPVHERTVYGFGAAATSFVGRRVDADKGVCVRRRRVRPAERGSLNTEPRDHGVSKRSGNKRTSNGTAVSRFSERKEVLIGGSLNGLTTGRHHLQISFGQTSYRPGISCG